MEVLWKIWGAVVQNCFKKDLLLASYTIGNKTLSNFFCCLLRNGFKEYLESFCS